LFSLAILSSGRRLTGLLGNTGRHAPPNVVPK
jgi:hypothetical protein